ncbi:antibiotic ABC transporter ATP-binding protein [Candidatus Poribacteria bacterium]|nr:MAG: antibiotic ABC transporter ATP-binding protein [Candidatus Poribacteria bacterium]
MFGTGRELHEYSDEEQELGKVYDRVLMKRLIAYLKPYRFQLVLVGFFILGNTLANLARPYLVQRAVDENITPGQLEGLGTIAILMVLALISEFVCSYFEESRTQVVGQHVMRDLRQTLFSHLQRLDVQFFDKNPVGRLMTRVMGDVQVLNELFSSGVITGFANLVKITGIMVAMLLYNWKLALATFTVIPIIFGATLVYQIYSRRAFREQRKQLARINAFLQENIVGMTTMKLFAQERRSYLRFNERNRKYLAANLRSIFYFSIFHPLIEVMASLATAVIIWYGGGQIVQGALTLGVLIAFIGYAERFFWPIRELSEKYTIFQNAMASSERIFHLLDTPPAIVSTAPKSETPKTLKGEIEFRNVWFAYHDDDYVLRDVSFKVKPGEKVALVGHTGAGKTSIINILCRFYEIDKGHILIDGVDIRDMALEELREAISIVQQNIFLFSDSIERNISLGKSSVSSEQVERAAKDVHLDRFVQRMPDVYGSVLKEDGGGLSVGQKQLVAFARALASDPSILVLDEATSSVDTETEILIEDALSRLMENRTSVVIAHRLSTIQNADKILVMHRGQIRETGTHAELLQQRGIYYRLYQLQYKGQEALRGR